MNKVGEHGRGGANATSVLVVVLSAVLLSMAAMGQADPLKPIPLNVPSKTRGLPFMEALWAKASAQEWSETELNLQDLSDLLWAANGINRPEIKKYTASSAMNAHDVNVYVFMKSGVYLYDAGAHVLNPVLAGDHRADLMMARPPRPPDAGGPGTPPPPPPDAGGKMPERPSMPVPSNPPVQLILVSVSSRFRMGTPELKYEWGAIDAGIVSQNISLFCAATGLKTRPRASMDKAKIKALLNLTDAHHVLLNHPVGYAK